MFAFRLCYSHPTASYATTLPSKGRQFPPRVGAPRQVKPARDGDPLVHCGEARKCAGLTSSWNTQRRDLGGGGIPDGFQLTWRSHRSSMHHLQRRYVQTTSLSLLQIFGMLCGLSDAQSDSDDRSCLTSGIRRKFSSARTFSWKRYQIQHALT